METLSDRKFLDALERKTRHSQARQARSESRVGPKEN